MFSPKSYYMMTLVNKRKLSTGLIKKNMTTAFYSKNQSKIFYFTCFIEKNSHTQFSNDTGDDSLQLVTVNIIFKILVGMLNNLGNYLVDINVLRLNCVGL